MATDFDFIVFFLFCFVVVVYVELSMRIICVTRVREICFEELLWQLTLISLFFVCFVAVVVYVELSMRILSERDLF